MSAASYYSMPILKVEVHSVSEVKMHCGVGWTVGVE